MENKLENYRIIESSNNCFFIQKKIIEIKGFLFWKKKIVNWKRVDKHGIPYYYFKGITNTNHFIDYNSFNKAMSAVNDFQKHPKIYEFEDNKWRLI